MWLSHFLQPTSQQPTQFFLKTPQHKWGEYVKGAFEKVEEEKKNRLCE